MLDESKGITYHEVISKIHTICLHSEVNLGRNVEMSYLIILLSHRYCYRPVFLLRDLGLT